MTTLKDLKKGKTLEGTAIYKVKPVILLSKDDVVLAAGTLAEILEAGAGSNYYDKCKVEYRAHDLAYNNNAKIGTEEAPATKAPKNLKENTWRVKWYNAPFALTDISIIRPHLVGGGSIQWNYSIMIEIYPTKKGVDNEGSRASGGAHAAIISNPPTKHINHPLIEIGSIIETPFGNYRVEFASRTDRDNLKLTEVK